MTTLSFVRSVLIPHSLWLGDRRRRPRRRAPVPRTCRPPPWSAARHQPPRCGALGAAVLGARQCGPFSEAGSPRLPRNTILDVARTPRATPVGTTTAVSYTHLRAHETVLDLVCRLL